MSNILVESGGKLVEAEGVISPEGTVAYYIYTTSSDTEPQLVFLEESNGSKMPYPTLICDHYLELDNSTGIMACYGVGTACKFSSYNGGVAIVICGTQQ